MLMVVRHQQFIKIAYLIFFPFSMANYTSRQDGPSLALWLVYASGAIVHGGV